MAKEVTNVFKGISLFVVFAVLLSGCNAFLSGHIGGRNPADYPPYESRQQAVNDLKSRDSFVRVNAVGALGELGAEESIELLINASRDSSYYVRRQSVESLYNIFLRTNDERAIEGISNLIADDAIDSYYGSISAFAKERLEKLGRLSVPVLIFCLNNKNQKFTIRAIEILTEIGDPRAVEPLMSILQNKNININILNASAQALGQLKDKRAVEPLITLLKDKNQNVRSAVVDALGELQDKRAVEPLVGLLKGKKADINVIKALGKIKDKRAAGYLIPFLNRKNEVLVVYYTAWALGEIKDPAAAKPLVDILADERELTIVVKPFDAAGERWLDFKIPENVDNALVNIGQPAVDFLKVTLKHKNSKIRLRAENILARIEKGQ